MSRLVKPLFMPIGKWMPDVPEWRNTGAIVAKNVLPRDGFYAPLKKPVVFTDALADPVKGAVAAVRSIDGTAFNYVGTAGKLYVMTSTMGWTDITRLAGGDYTVADTDRVEFAQFGETILSVNGWTDALQTITLGGTNFADLAAAPKARHIAVVGNFVVLGNTLDTIDGGRTHRVWWSAFDDASDWTPSLATQCNWRDMRGSGGAVRRIIGGEYGSVLRERSIARMSYIGPPGVFQFDEIEDSHGTIAPWSAIKLGRLLYYLSDDGWYAFDGQQSVSIGRDIIDTTFFADLQTAYAHNVVGAVDPVTKFIHWIYPGAGAVGGMPNRDLIYNPIASAFALAEFTNEFVAPLYTSIAPTTDNVDAIFANTDAVTGLTDDQAYTGGNLQLGFFDADHRLNFLAGDNQPAQFDTGERQLTPGGRTFLDGLQPMLDTTNGVTITCLERDLPSDGVTTGESDTIGTDGEAHPRSEARYHRLRITVAEDTPWSKADGVYITEAENSGIV